jgi:hypothetical protein
VRSCSWIGSSCRTPWGKKAYVLLCALSHSGGVRAVFADGMTFAHLIEASTRWLFPVPLGPISATRSRVTLKLIGRAKGYLVGAPLRPAHGLLARHEAPRSLGGWRSARQAALARAPSPAVRVGCPSARVSPIP